MESSVDGQSNIHPMESSVVSYTSSGPSTKSEVKEIVEKKTDNVNLKDEEFDDKSSASVSPSSSSSSSSSAS